MGSFSLYPEAELDPEEIWPYMVSAWGIEGKKGAHIFYNAIFFFNLFHPSPIDYFLFNFR